MRASRSWPRSSVPKGWRHEGTPSLTLKSMSLIGTLQSHGPSATASMMTSRIAAPASAMRWRRNRRHASRPSEAGGARLAGAAPGALAVDDAGVEPAIEQVGDQVEEDHQA